MAKAFDATTKHLIERYPRDWLAYASLPLHEDVRVVDADLSSVGPAADKLIRVGGPAPYLAHLELQAGADAKFDRRVLVYNVLAGWRHDLPVRSVAVLLRPQAAGGVTGSVRQTVANDAELTFRYRVLRVWEQPPELLLAGGLGTLPLAPVSDVAPDHLGDVVRRMEKRLDADADPPLAKELWTATFILMGLRHPPELVRQVLKGVRQMKESSTYQAIIEEGVEQGLQRGRAEGRALGERIALVGLGTQKFGPPDAARRAALDAVTDVDRLEAMINRLFEATSWDDLLRPS